MIDVLITIPMIPMGKGRAKSAKLPTGGTRHYTPEETESWESCFRRLCATELPKVPLEGAVRVDILAVFPRPKRLMRRSDPDGFVLHTSKPDKDNIDKITFDALKRHVRDDAQICVGCTIKVHAEKYGLPRTVVRIRQVPPAYSVSDHAYGLGLLEYVP